MTIFSFVLRTFCRKVLKYSTIIVLYNPVLKNPTIPSQHNPPIEVLGNPSRLSSDEVLKKGGLLVVGK